MSLKQCVPTIGRTRKAGMMTTTSIDFATLLQGIPAGAWVAISEERNAVLAYGADAETVAHEAGKQGEAHPLIVRVPEQALMMFL
jgi:hypothetical protein